MRFSGQLDDSLAFSFLGPKCLLHVPFGVTVLLHPSIKSRGQSRSVSTFAGEDTHDAQGALGYP